MKTIQQDVLGVAIYDEFGKFLNEIKFGKEVELTTYRGKSGKEYYLYVQDVVQDTDMLELIGRKITNEKSDFEKDSFTTPEVKTIRFSSEPETRKLKIVGTGIDYNLDTGDVEHDIKIIFPNVEMGKEVDFTFRAGEAKQPAYLFKVLPFNDEGDLYEMQFKKRKSN